MKPHNDRKWRKLRAAKLSIDPLCQYCGHEIADQVDHIIPVSKGGDMWEPSNLKSSCQSCHSHKTMVVDRLGLPYTQRVIKGVDPQTGLPINPNHWWNR